MGRSKDGWLQHLVDNKRGISWLVGGIPTVVVNIWLILMVSYYMVDDGFHDNLVGGFNLPL